MTKKMYICLPACLENFVLVPNCHFLFAHEPEKVYLETERKRKQEVFLNPFPTPSSKKRSLKQEKVEVKENKRN